jgi:plasmid stabilization system protein ParE
MASKIEITPEAENDIFSLAAEIQKQNNSATAKLILAEIKNQLNALAEYPELGRVGGCEGTREIVMAGMPYITIFERINNLVVVVRVLRGSDGNQANV